MKNFFSLRREFMQRFDIAIPAQPCCEPDTLAMWETMLEEELLEFREALHAFKNMPSDQPDERHRRMAELTAEGVDVLNVLTGLLLSQGMPVEAMAEEIHAANLRKCVNGQIVRRADGKVLKPEGWQPANKQRIIQEAQQAGDEMVSANPRHD